LKANDRIELQASVSVGKEKQVLAEPCTGSEVNIPPGKPSGSNPEKTCSRF
jgi:hypothetical protein